MSKFVGTGPSSYKKRIYWATVSQRLRNTGLGDCVEDEKNCITLPSHMSQTFIVCNEACTSIAYMI